MEYVRFFLFLVMAACSSGTTKCDWPPDTASDASPVGCTATRSFNTCEEGGACQNQCKDSEYGLSCYQTAAPDSRCRALPLPTPQHVTIYCCPCGG